MSGRRYTVMGIFLMVGLILLTRLFYIQVINEEYKQGAESNILKKETIYPSRGLIVDRNGEILVSNSTIYDLMVIPSKVNELDTSLMLDILGLDMEGFKERLSKAKRYSRRKQSVFYAQIGLDMFGKLQENLFRFKGFFVRPRTTRNYPRSVAPHLLGYLGEVDQRLLKKDSADYYALGDYIGISGIEKDFEDILRGDKGVQHLLVDVYNRTKGRYNEGALDKPAKAGAGLQSTLDVDLQAYGEKLMGNKIGSIVAIEPETGEILALLSAPAYDPNLLVGRSRSENYPLLLADTLKPLFNRALNSTYMPGSIFKIIQAIAGQEMGIISPSTTFYCDGSLIGDHVRPGRYDLFEAIKQSSNMYFYLAMKRMVNQGEAKSIFKDTPLGLAKWEAQMKRFGLGQSLALDVGATRAGFIPGPQHYDKVYGQGRWAYSTIYSISIGQGEVELTPVQMANLAAIIANRGYYRIPHFLRYQGIDSLKEQFYAEKHYASRDTGYFDVAIRAMRAVVDEPGGTARRARTPGISVCGKTGTVENSHGEDHSVFMAFAPQNNPKIAISVYVENAGFGGTWAAPIASLMIEKYLTDSISRPAVEKRILDRDFIREPIEKDGETH